jgi:cytoskeletal protein CcmA (bactofilin family)
MASIFGGRRLAPPPPTIDGKPETIIGAATSFNGDLQAEGTLRIEGRVEGSVTTTGNVIVGPTARVTASICGQNILVAGVVQGNITAAQRLEIIATGKVSGDITARVLLIEEGGLFSGHSTMRDESTPDALPVLASNDLVVEHTTSRGERATDLA